MWPETGRRPSASIYPLKGDMQSAITNQPKSHPRQPFVPEIPEGLQQLSATQHLFIKQSVYSPLETQYEVLNSEGEKIFMADETTDTSTKAWCRGTKPFDVSVLIRSGMYRKEVLKMNGEPRSCGCGGDISLRSTKALLGTIEQGTDCSVPHYFIKDAEGEELLQIVGPSNHSMCFNFSLDPGGEFEVIQLGTGGGCVVGKIAKYEKNSREKVPGDIWGVKFPHDMKVTHKALLLAACFLLNFEYQNVE